MELNGTPCWTVPSISIADANGGVCATLRSNGSVRINIINLIPYQSFFDIKTVTWPVSKEASNLIICAEAQNYDYQDGTLWTFNFGVAKVSVQGTTWTYTIYVSLLDSAGQAISSNSYVIDVKK